MIKDERAQVVKLKSKIKVNLYGGINRFKLQNSSKK